MVYAKVRDIMQNKKALTFEIPPGTISITIALALVYDKTLALTWLVSLCILWNILKALGWVK